MLLPLTVRRGSRALPPQDDAGRKGDEVDFLIFEPKRDEAEAWLTENGWISLERPSSVGA
ncbi:MAG: hypothetical protein HKN12_12090 [Gemmatimonadetes bacterium]|nr:hypothetical protein [Gemmatimonadota bacterium]